MTDNELLLAISNMMDEKFKSNLSPIENRMSRIENRMSRIEFALENEITPRLNSIESCYTDTFNRYKDSVEKYDSILMDIDILKKVVTEHSDKLQKIS